MATGAASKVICNFVLRNLHTKEIIAKDNKLLQSELASQHKQLTMQAVNMVQYSELLQAILSELSTIIPYTDKEGKSIIKSLEFKINDKSNDHIWKEFELCFEKVYSGFYKKLHEILPDISVREQILCAFLKMNMSTKEIAALTFQTPNSIDVAKHRLRKKIGLKTDEAFSSFLTSL